MIITNTKRITMTLYMLTDKQNASEEEEKCLSIPN